MFFETYAIFIVYIAYLAFIGKRLLTYMHAMQQEEYDGARLIQWMAHYKVFDKKMSFVLLGSAVAIYFIPPVFAYFLIFIGFSLIAFFEPDPRKDAKKKLAMTARTKRIYVPAFIAMAVLGFPFFMGGLVPWNWLVLIHVAPFSLIIVNALQGSIEKSIQQTYWQEAHNKVMALNPIVIGITGSFGKTSVKHILGHILKSHAPTLITPGSVNTPMGITRIIREDLLDSHRFFVVEMGAYGLGSIDRLCRLTPPNVGVITAIGHAHYERFKDLNTVARTKYELAEAVIQKDGHVIVHERTLRFEESRSLKDLHRDMFTVCGESSAISKPSDGPSYLEDKDLQIQGIYQREKGLEVRFTWSGTTHSIEAPLYGLHHGHNLVLAFATASELGIPIENIHAAFRTLPQIRHRLEVKKQPDGRVIIDDAYNSNPLGFRSALDLLELIGKNKRKILITPGMVEMGAAHDELHKNIGKYAGEVCDVVLAVSPKRIPTFKEGFKESGGGKEFIEVDTFKNASAWIEKNKTDRDVILIENDLPDIYERVPKL